MNGDPYPEPNLEKLRGCPRDPIPAKFIHDNNNNLEFLLLDTLKTCLLFRVDLIIMLLNSSITGQTMNDKRKPGRPATGQTTVTIRIPKVLEPAIQEWVRTYRRIIWQPVQPLKPISDTDKGDSPT